MIVIIFYKILLLSVISAFLGFGFQRMMEDGMIFSWYRDFLERLPYTKNNGYPMHSDAGEYKFNKIIYYLTKPLGLCITCNTVWIGITLGILFTEDINIVSAVHILLYGGVSAGIVTFIESYYNYLKRN